MQQLNIQGRLKELVKSFKSLTWVLEVLTGLWIILIIVMLILESTKLHQIEQYEYFQFDNSKQVVARFYDAETNTICYYSSQTISCVRMD